jgi:hypothetical protein
MASQKYLEGHKKCRRAEIHSPNGGRASNLIPNCYRTQASQLHEDLPCMPILGTCFQHNLGAFRHVSLNFNSLKLNWVIVIVIIPENHIFLISGINLGHLGADLSILRKFFRGHFFPNLGTVPESLGR